jgi:hypothetical protein
MESDERTLHEKPQFLALRDLRNPTFNTPVLDLKRLVRFDRERESPAVADARVEYHQGHGGHAP